MLLVVLGFVVLSASFNCVLSTSYSIIPKRTSSCPVEGIPCLTLSEFVDEHLLLYDNLTSSSSDIALIFEPGKHNLDTELAISNINSLTILAANSISSLEDVTITCNTSTMFTFQAIGHVLISGIEFVDCAASTGALVGEFAIEDCTFSGRGGLDVKQTMNLKISRSSFSFNVARPLDSDISAGFYVSSENVLIRSCLFHETVANNVSSVFFQNSTVTMIDTVFINNVAYGLHGVIVLLVNSNVTTENCTLENNTVYDVDSGAMFSYESNVAINNCKFLNNNSTQSSGGALVGIGSTIRVNNSTFHNNYAGALGGAVYVIYSAVTLNNSRFLSNSALYDGGAVYCNDSTITMDYNTFINNSATLYYGGAVTVFSGIVIIHRNTFVSNTAGKRGGALFAQYYTLIEVADSNFTNNTAYNSGGAINIEVGVVFTTTGSRYISNSAWLGGAVNIFHANGSINNTIFIKNNAKLSNTWQSCHGGAMFIENSSVSITHSRFDNNSASSSHHRPNHYEYLHLATSGGAIATVASNIEIEDTIFHHNNVYIHINKNTLLVDNVYIPSTCYGGAINTLNSRLIVRNAEFLKNTANCSFGSVPLAGNNTRISNGSDPIAFIDLYTAGGAIFMWGSESDEIEDSLFVENMVHAVCVMADNNTIFLGITSVAGALYARNSSLTIKSTTFSENIANASHLSSIVYVAESVSGTTVKSEGGALYTKLSNSTIDESNFIGNRAYAISTVGENSSILNDISSTGGAIHSESSTFTVDYTAFANNTAIIGFAYTSNSVESADTWTTTQTLRETQIYIAYNRPSINHMSASSGGALHVFPNSSVTITNCEFVNNTAMLGGAVTTVPSNHVMKGPTYEAVSNYTDNSEAFSIGFVVIENSTFRNNNAAATTGGALYVHNATITIHNSTFIGNKAGGNVLKLINGTFTQTYNNGEIHIVDHAIAAAGAISIINSTCELYTCTFTNNTDTAAVWLDSSATISNTMFESNSGVYGGVAQIAYSDVEIVNSVLVNNKCSDDFGDTGALFSLYSSLTIDNSSIIGNRCQRKAFPSSHGAVSVLYSVVIIHSTTFADNTADNESGIGGALSAMFSTVVIDQSIFSNCTTKEGGAFQSSLGNVTITNSEFYNNEAVSYGGALFISDGPVSLQNCIFSGNGPQAGGTIYINSVSLVSLGYLVIQDSINKNSFLSATNCTVFFYGNTTLSHNSGPLLVFSSNVTFAGHTDIINNTFGLESYNGVISAFQSEIVFTNRTNLSYNGGNNTYGGAISTSESKIYVYGEISISHNTASWGGGIYFYQSELNVFGKAEIVGNRAFEKGGGIYAVGSIVRLMKGSLHLKQNIAIKDGGGMYLKTHSKIYVVKTNPECRNRSALTHCFGSDCTCNDNNETWLALKFTENHAYLGGALYVTDDTNSDTCAANTTSTSNCFFQSLVAYGIHIDPAVHPHTLNTYFVNNSASEAGGTIFGGLLDRCYVNNFAEVFEYYSHPISALSYLTEYNVTNLEQENIQSEISSFPVRVCFCQNNKPDCSYRPQALQIRKGERFAVSVVAVDQVNNTISNTTVYSSVTPLAGLREGQAIQDTGESCTGLTYNVVSPHDSEQLSLYAEGPCRDFGMSVTSIGLTFTLCPVGFIMSKTSCDCDPCLYPDYVLNCLIDTESVLRRDNAWISYDNTTGQQIFLTHLHCPFDYCQPPNEKVWINLNVPKGADVQCAFNRSGILCGACKEGLSLALGSSHCLPCSNNWLALVILFALAGIALVAFLLVCNMTVAEGTINGLIFYANIIATNQAILTPTDESNVLSIFVAWLNLDLGIETCFFNGMDSYAKVWLQLAFPLYVIFLVVVVIVICEHSEKITRLLSRKNPVTTLATLILLSYTKLLTVIIAAFSFTTLESHDDSRKAVWLIDANVCYFEWKHVLLFTTALFILTVGTLYTLVLFSLQWLMRVSNRPIFKWVNSPRLLPLMEAYHGPYNVKHRYWTGLLLIVRVLLYLVYALNIQGDPSVNLLTILCVCITLLVVSNLAGRIYKNWLINAMEVSILFNLTLISAGMLYIQESKQHHFQPVVSRVSIAVAFLTFLLVLCYHTYKFVLAKHLEKLKHKLTEIKRHSYYGTDGKPIITREFTSINEVDDCSVTEINGLPPIDDNDTTAFVTTTLDDKECDSEADKNLEDHIYVDFTPPNSDTSGNVSNGTNDQYSLITNSRGDDSAMPTSTQSIELKRLDYSSESYIQ